MELLDLPAEVILLLCTFLPVSAVVQLCSSCKALRSLRIDMLAECYDARKAAKLGFYYSLSGVKEKERIEALFRSFPPRKRIIQKEDIICVPDEDEICPFRPGYDKRCFFHAGKFYIYPEVFCVVVEYLKELTGSYVVPKEAVHRVVLSNSHCSSMASWVHFPIIIDLLKKSASKQVFSNLMISTLGNSVRHGDLEATEILMSHMKRRPSRDALTYILAVAPLDTAKLVCETWNLTSRHIDYLKLMRQWCRENDVTNSEVAKYYTRRFGIEWANE